MNKNKNGPTVVFKDDTGSSIYLKHIGRGPVLAVGVGEFSGPAVFQVSKAMAEEMLTQRRYRPATRDEIKEYLEQNAGHDGIKQSDLTKELQGVPANVHGYFETPDHEKGIQAPPGLKGMKAPKGFYAKAKGPVMAPPKEVPQEPPEDEPAPPATAVGDPPEEVTP